MRTVVLVILLVFSLVACTAGNQQASTPEEEIPTLIPTVTPILVQEVLDLSPTPTLVPTFTLEPTETTLPTETAELPGLQERVVETYRTLLTTEVNLNLIQEIARGVQNGEIDTTGGFSQLVALIVLLNEVDQQAQSSEPPPALLSYWDEAMRIHHETHSLADAWINQEVDAAQVLEQSTPLLERAVTNNHQAEAAIAQTYNVPQAELTRIRQEAVSSTESFFATPAPTRTP